jgi:hypothetical protein
MQGLKYTIVGYTQELPSWEMPGPAGVTIQLHWKRAGTWERSGGFQQFPVRGIIWELGRHRRRFLRRRGACAADGQIFFVDFVLQFVMKKKQKWAESEKKTG